MNCHFINNKAPKGGIYQNIYGYIHNFNTTFINNWASIGGILYSNGNCEFNDSIILQTKVEKLGIVVVNNYNS